MKHPKLIAEERKILGKQIKNLRREGILPANVYGKDLASLAIQVKTTDFSDVFAQAGETGLVDLEVKGEIRPVLIKNLQMKYPLKTPLHVDFYQVNLKEKVKTMVPIALIGEAQAISEKLGTLLQPLSEVEVEALPADLPEKIEVAIEHLAAIDDQVTVADLKVPTGVTILTDAGQTVVKIAELVAPEPEPVAEEAAEAVEAGAEETKEGADTAEAATEEKSEDKKE